MASKKTSSGRSGAKKPASTAKKPGGTKKNTTSRSSGAARAQTKKPAARSGAAKSAPRKQTPAKTAPARQPAARSAPRGQQPQPRQPIRREVGAVVLLFVGLIALIAYFPVEGWLVDIVRRASRGLVGWGFYLVPVCVLWCAFILGFHHGRPVILRLSCVLGLPLVFGAFVHMLFFSRNSVFPDAAALESLRSGFRTLWTVGNDMTEYCGGVLAGVLGIILKKSVGVIGSFVVMLAAFVLMMLEGFGMSVADIAEWIKERPRLAYEPVPEDEEPDPDEFFSPEDYLFPLNGGKPIRKVEPPPERPRTATFTAPAPEPEKPASVPASTKKQTKRSLYDQSKEQEKDQLFAQFEVDPQAMAQVAAALDAKQAQRTKKPAAQKPAARKTAIATGTEGVKPLSVSDAADIAGVEINSADMDGGAASPEKVRRLSIDKDAEAAAVAKQIETQEEDKAEYIFPPVDLLNQSADGQEDGGDVDLDETQAQLESAIRSFGVGATIVGAIHGPTITRYELKLDQGVKLNKITNLAGDIALSLGVVSVRIAPIPDKISTVGVEVPNKNVRTVWLGDVIDSTAFKNAKNKLSVALGKDIGGNVIIGNIARMPHVLIAGTTGSGKSVCINSLILSLLYKSTPEEVRMIMIDPKMVELGIYNGMPHLYVPVVTDPKKAAGALQWSVVEMLKRYRLFSEKGVRDLAGYNTIMKNEGSEALPQVVIIIDELADLMMVASKEVEESICRVAQMGRAAGMHLVVATQRPSADVITGLMKANIPSRIAFAVSSALESRIILDQQGAEKLVGSGDMLYSPIGSKPLRVQGAFVTDEEREEIINFVKKEAEAEYSDEILAEIEKAAVDKDAKNAEPEDADKDKNDYDELLPQAVDVIFETKQASVSMLQRRLKLGYSRAARLIDQLEEVGVVGPYEGSKPRQIVITKQQWQEMQYAHGTAPVDTIAQEFAQVSESDEFASVQQPAAEEEAQGEFVREAAEDDQP